MVGVSSLQTVELGVLGPLQVRQYGLPVAIPGAKPRAILTMLGLHGGSVVSADTLVALLWGDDPPRTAEKALQTHISSLRRALGDGFVLTEGTGWTLSTSEIDASRYKLAVRLGRDAAAAGDTSQAVARFEEALTLWRGVPELLDGQRGTSEKTRWIEGHAALVEDRADALLATGRAAEIVGELEAAVAEAPLRERRWGQLMLALYRAGRQGEALGAYQRARSLLAEELGVDPGPDLRRLEAAIVAQDAALEMPVSHQLSAVTRAVTFLLTDIEGSTAAWEADADAMAVALARHDEIVEQVVTSRGGRLIKTRGEGDATFSVFDRPSAAAAASIELQEAIRHEPWALAESMRIRVALHTGEVELRDGDYFGRAVNRAARLRSLAAGGQILCSGATAELVIDSLSDDVLLVDLGMRQLKNLPRPEHVFELRLETADESRAPTPDVPMERPGMPAVLSGPGPFVGRGPELERLLSAWQATLAGGTGAVLIAGEPGVGKTRLAGEWSRLAYEQGAVVLYGRCDEDLGVPYQPFAEALRSLVACLGTKRLRGLRGVEALLPLVPGLTDALPDLATPTRADPDTERYALFDAVVAMLGVASASAPVVLILDDLHWAAKPTLLLLRHLLRFGEHARVQIIGTYRSTDLDRSHPLAAMLADLHRDGSANRLALSGLDEGDVTAYVAEAGYDDEELARALATVTGGNPFFLIEALRHVDESGGRWDPSTLPQGVREAVSRRLSRLPTETNKALAAAAVVGSRFALALVESVVGDDLIDAFDEACKAGIVIEEPGGRYRFNHAIVRQSLLAELASVRRMRLHQKIAATLETEPGADDELLAELAYHYFECAWAGNAAKAVDYCRRAADQAMARLAYEGAADLYDRALHALDELDDELPNRDDQQAELLVARCDALLAAGDVVSATGAVSQLQEAARDSVRLAAWGTCFDGQLSMLTDPERLDEIESALSAAAEKLAGLDDAAGEAKAHTVRAGCLARLGRIGDCETALDQALTAARRAREHRRVNAVLAQAPLAALWGPNPVPRAGGRCLDVVRLLRITTGSPVVEATSTRCQGVLDAFRGRAAAGRQLIDSARRALTELGMRHALLEVDQFAGIVELVADDPASAEPHLRRAYVGFRRMGLDVDTAEAAALLARVCLALDNDDEADELCTESERLAGHALKASIAWRTVRAQLLARSGAHDEARRVAEEAVALAGHTDALVDHGDACLALATVLDATGDTAGARAAADKAVELYELKGAAALAEMARGILGERDLPIAPTAPEEATVEPHNACVRAAERVAAAIDRKAGDEFEQLFAPEALIESRRKVVGFTQFDFPLDEWLHETRRIFEEGAVSVNVVVVAVRGERLALARVVVGTADASPGAPQDEYLQLYGIDEEGRIALQVWFDLEDIDAAMAELDAAYARLEERHPRAPLENAASRVQDRYLSHFATRKWDAMAEALADDISGDDRRHVVNSGVRSGRDAEIANLKVIAEIGCTDITSTPIATRGERLVLARHSFTVPDWPEPFDNEMIDIVEINTDDQVVAEIAFDPDDIDAAIEELDARYLAGEAAAYAHTWSVITAAYAEFNRHDHDPSSVVNVDHRRVARFAPGDLTPANTKDLMPNLRAYVEAVHRLNDCGAVVTCTSYGTAQEGFEAEWRTVLLQTVDGDLMNRNEMFDEADLDTAIAKFEQLTRPAPRVENAASQVCERFRASFAARDWDAIAEMLADDVRSDDRRRVVNSGLRQGRDAAVAELSAIADVGVTNWESDTIAIRGGRVVLDRTRVSDNDERSEAYVINVFEIDTDGRVVTRVVFDLDDIDAAFAELDARYLAGEAAAHARTWSLIAEAYAALNRHEIPATTPDWTNIDHRRGIAVAPGDLIASVRAAWDIVPDLTFYIEAVHRLSHLGAVVAHASKGTAQEDFHAEWCSISLLTVDCNLLSRCELFDEADLDAALARFDELSRPAPGLENGASRAYDRFNAYLADRDWDAMAELIADDVCSDDRRRVVSSGIQRGRDAQIANLRAVIDVGVRNMESVVLATRGERLALTRTRVSGGDRRPDAFGVELLNIVEIDTDNRIVGSVAFDVDDFDAAIAEIDARYLAGEAAAHAHTWSVFTQGHAAFNRRELPATTPDWVNLDHRRGAAFAPGEAIAYVRAGWDLDQVVTTYIEEVHRLNELGAVFTWAGHGTSQEGFDAEWRGVNILTVEGDQISRSEIFDEADIDAALARFDELRRPAQRLENAASQVDDRFEIAFAACDFDAMAEMMADDICVDDRRPAVNAGLRRGRDAEIANMRAIAELGGREVTSSVIAIRGDRLALSRNRFSGRDQRPEAFRFEAVCIIEIDNDGRIVARVSFDPDDIDSAFEELDARYLAGEASPKAHTWSVIARTYAEFNRHGRVPEPAWVSVDHRRGSIFASSDLNATIRASRELTPDLSIYIETVHRLSDFGAVVTNSSVGTAHEGFAAEWRMIQLLTVEGDRISRLEMFDEEDLDAALAKFDELSRPAPRLENAASRAGERFRTCYAARDWDAMAEMVTDDMCNDDRRPIVGAGLRRGRNVEIANVRALAEIGVRNIASSVIAIRGERLALGRLRLSGRDQRPEAFHAEALGIIEIDADDRIAARVWFDIDDTDAAFEELDARYLAGEPAAHAHTWSVIASGYAALNRHEVPPTTPDWVNIDHRRGIAFAPGDMISYIRATWDVAPDVNIHIEAVHRLSNRGAVVTHAASGSSQAGFDAEWGEIVLLMVEGDAVNHCEMFDEADIDAALARFDELTRSAPRLDNAASQMYERFNVHFAARDWGAITLTMAEDVLDDDRRRVVGAGVRHGRNAAIANVRAVADVGITDITSTVIATRGGRLALSRERFAGRGQRREAFYAEVLGIVEINADDRIVARVAFDPDDVDTAFEELDARYLAGEAAAHAHTWSVISGAVAAANRHETFSTTPDWVNIDHHRGTSFEPGELNAYIRSSWDDMPDGRTYVEAVHRLSNLGAVITHRAEGTTRDGFEAEWRGIDIMMVDGDLINRSELFEEADLDAALARFDELNSAAPQLENAATRAWAHIVDAYNRRDLDGFLAQTTTDGRLEDRRKLLRASHEGQERRKAAEAWLRAPESWRIEIEPIAIRGDRLGLTRERSRDTGEADRPIVVETLTLAEVNDDELVHHTVIFDPDDINGAIAELTARWIASGEVAHPEVIELARQSNEAYNRHDWDAIATIEAGATYVNHRQLATEDPETIVDHWLSIRTLASLIPDMWVEPAEIFTHSAIGLVSNVVVRGTTAEGAAIELPAVILIVFDGAHVIRMEAFDLSQRDIAVARFHELNTST
jgi:class 3 adenylate cyclase